MSIEKAIKQLAGEAKMHTLMCKVTGVDKQKCTCDAEPVNGSATRYSVRLRSVIDGSSSGVVLFPAVGSQVIIGAIESNMRNWMVIQYSEVDEVQLRGDAYNGLVKLDQLNQNLDTIKQYLQALVVNITTQLAAIDTPTFGVPTTAPAFQSSMEAVPLVFVNMENPKVKHG